MLAAGAVLRIPALTRIVIFHLRAVFAQNAVLVKNSGALAIGTGATAVLGFAYWWLAARSFSPEVVGKASALLSLMGLVGLIGEGGLTTLLTGEIIRRPGRAGGLISAAALASLFLSLAAGGLGLMLLYFMPSGGVNSHGLAGLWFLIGCGLTGLSGVIDASFTGMLRSDVRMFRQLLFSACKLVFIAAAAGWTSDAAAILLTWVSGQTISLIFIELLARRRRESLIRRPDFQLLHQLKQKAVDHYRLDLVSQAPGIILPYLVMVLLSPASNAPFSAIWMMFVIASVAPAALTTVLFPVVRAEPEQYRSKMALSLGVSFSFALAFGLFVFAYSEEVLRIFNPAYMQIAGSSLRFLGFGLIGAVVKFHIQAGARLSNSMRRASVWFCVGGLFELSGAIIGCRMGALEGFVVGWVTAIVIEAGIMLLIALSEAQWRLAVSAVADNLDG
jgi:O-antigen/teichoic acid export membrane protein